MSVQAPSAEAREVGAVELREERLAELHAGRAEGELSLRKSMLDPSRDGAANIRVETALGDGLGGHDRRGLSGRHIEISRNKT